MLSEAVVLGLLRQNVRIFLCVLGHGSTEVGEVLRIYDMERADLLVAIGTRFLCQSDCTRPDR